MNTMKSKPIVSKHQHRQGAVGPLLTSAAIAVTLLQAPAAQAAGSYVQTEVRASILSGDSWNFPDDGTIWRTSQYNSAVPLRLDDVRAFDVIDAQGQPAVTTFQYNATASAGNGALSVYAHAHVSNAMPRGDAPPYTVYSNGRFEVQPGGVAEGFSAEAYASLMDTVHVGPGVSRLQFQLTVNGELRSGAETSSPTWFTPEASFGLWQLDCYNLCRATPPQGLFQAHLARSYDAATDTWPMAALSVTRTLWSGDFEVRNGAAILALDATASAEVSDTYGDIFGRGSLGDPLDAVAQFGHTVQVIGVRGFNAAGQQVALGSVIGDSGTVYALAPVPEPATWALWLAALLLVPTVARRRGRHHG